MNWRRGLLLAGMNLLAAVPLICLLAAQDAQFMKEREQHSANEEGLRIDSSGEVSAAPTKIVQAQEEQTVTFSPCGLWANIPAQESVVQVGNLPVFIVSQWRESCPAKWSISRMLGVDDGWLISDANFKAMRRVDLVLCVLIAVQWFLVGGFPLRQSNHWWAEPGAFITANNFVAACIAIIPVIDGLARLPALIAFGGWVWWLGLVLWKIGCLTWQSTVGRQRRLTH
ncbi:MAG: hypothetical protein WCA10_05285 [Terracidiphilus sp.]